MQVKAPAVGTRSLATVTLAVMAGTLIGPLIYAEDGWRFVIAVPDALILI
jgi:hypothetical protein